MSNQNWNKLLESDPHGVDIGAMLDNMAQDRSFELPGAPPLLGSYPFHHIDTFSGKHVGGGRTYVPYDQALQDSRENARYMETDSGIMECIEARIRAVSLLGWKFSPDIPTEEGKQLAGEMTAIFRRIRRFLEFRKCLLRAIWIGKYGVVWRAGWESVGGSLRVMPKPLGMNDYGWRPLHGDKIVFRYDDGRGDELPSQMGILVGADFKPGDKIRDNWTVESTTLGRAYFLSNAEQRLIVLHKHMIEDSPWENPTMAGRIHGVGIRDRIYWDWFQKQELLRFLMEYLERSAGGVEIWPYPQGDENFRKALIEAINFRVANSRNYVLMPRPPAEFGTDYQPTFVEPGMAGINHIRDLLDTYFGHRIKRYILGQTLTSEAGTTGLGSGVADIHLNTFLNIVEDDAINLGETLTEFARTIQLWNWPSSKHIYLRFKVDLMNGEYEKRIAALKMAQDLGADVKLDDVYESAGVTPPTGNDKVVKSPRTMQLEMQQAAMQQQQQAQMSANVSGASERERLPDAPVI